MASQRYENVARKDGAGIFRRGYHAKTALIVYQRTIDPKLSKQAKEPRFNIELDMAFAFVGRPVVHDVE